MCRLLLDSVKRPSPATLIARCILRLELQTKGPKCRFNFSSRYYSAWMGFLFSNRSFFMEHMKKGYRQQVSWETSLYQCNEYQRSWVFEPSLIMSLKMVKTRTSGICTQWGYCILKVWYFFSPKNLETSCPDYL